MQINEFCSTVSIYELPSSVYAILSCLFLSSPSYTYLSFPSSPSSAKSSSLLFHFLHMKENMSFLSLGISLLFLTLLLTVLSTSPK